MEVEQVLTHARMLLYETQSYPVPADLADILRDGSDCSAAVADGGGEEATIDQSVGIAAPDGTSPLPETWAPGDSAASSHDSTAADCNTQAAPSQCNGSGEHGNVGANETSPGVGGGCHDNASTSSDGTTTSDATTTGDGTSDDAVDPTDAAPVGDAGGVNVGSSCNGTDTLDTTSSTHANYSTVAADATTTDVASGVSGADVPLLTPELLAVAPSRVIDACKTAFSCDANKDVAAALEQYLYVH